MSNPFNPLSWISAAQDWFRKTERSSGFRPYLIFLLIHFSAAISLLATFRGVEPVTRFAINSLYISVIAFVVYFGIKALHDPDFCRSERHIENVKRIELIEQKGDKGPRIIPEADIQMISDPTRPALPPSRAEKGGER